MLPPTTSSRRLGGGASSLPQASSSLRPHLPLLTHSFCNLLAVCNSPPSSSPTACNLFAICILAALSLTHGLQPPGRLPPDPQPALLSLTRRLQPPGRLQSRRPHLPPFSAPPAAPPDPPIFSPPFPFQPPLPFPFSASISHSHSPFSAPLAAPPLCRISHRLSPSHPLFPTVFPPSQLRWPPLRVPFFFPDPCRFHSLPSSSAVPPPPCCRLVDIRPHPLATPPPSSDLSSPPLLLSA